MNPKVSICIPAYNNYYALKRCIKSILVQTFKDFEVIITDDSNNKNIQQLSTLDKRIHYFSNAQQLGSPENWNKCIAIAQGEYIKIMHHDDWFSTPVALEKFVSFLDQHKKIDFIFSSCSDVNEQGTSITVHQLDKRKYDLLLKDKFSLIRGNNIGNPSTTFFRKSKNISFDKNLIWFVDIDFYIRIITDNNWGYLPDNLINIGISSTQITNFCLNHGNLIIKELMYLFNKYHIQTIKPYQGLLIKELAHSNIFSNQQLKECISFKSIKMPSSLFVKAFFYKDYRQIRQLIRSLLKK